jgi:hypothetical protein
MVSMLTDVVHRFATIFPRDRGIVGHNYSINRHIFADSVTLSSQCHVRL